MSTGGAQSILFDWGSDGGPDRIVDDGGDATQVIILCDRIRDGWTPILFEWHCRNICYEFFFEIVDVEFLNQKSSLELNDKTLKKLILVQALIA